jgi:malate dehydrogenase (oxaloacetate-decarboxylating)(NADP+)
MNQWKSAHAVETEARTLADAMEGADVFFGLSAKGALTPDMVKSMAPNPIIFAMANPDPGNHAGGSQGGPPDAIVATGRSDYPNQVNNVLGFPYHLPRRARRARHHDQRGDEDRRRQALAELAREDVPDEVAAAYRRARRNSAPNTSSRCRSIRA